MDLQISVPFRRELYAVSSRGCYGNAFSMTGVWSMNENTQCTWHWQVEAYDVSKWASAGIKGRLWNTSSSFLPSGDICFWSVSIMKRFRRCADPCQRFWHQMTHTIYALCVWAKSMHALFSREWSAFIVSFFLWESSALVCLFSRENWGNHLPPAARVQPLLRQRGDWDRGDHRWSLLTSLREEFFILRSSAADESKLLEEDVLYLTSSDPAGTALLAHGQGWADEGGEDISEPSQPVCPACVELLEVMERATAIKPTVEARKKGSGSQ